MKVVVKILKLLSVIVLLAAVVLVFWFGILQASGVGEMPIPLPVGLLEPPELSISSHLYDQTSVTKGGVTYNSPLGFPIFKKEAWDVNGKFVGDPTNSAIAHINKFSGQTEYNITDWNGAYNPANPFSSKIEQAIYLFNLASYNEMFATNYSYYTEAGGSADLAGIKGKLMSQSIRFVNREFDANTATKYTENYFNQQINALFETQVSSAALQSIVPAAEAILKIAKRSYGFGGDNYNISAGFSPSFVPSDSPTLTAAEKDAYKAFLAPSNQTAFAGRCTADWVASIGKSEKTARTPNDYSKYLGAGFPNELTAAERAEGYSVFKDVFRSKFIVKLVSDVFYNESSTDAANKPSVEIVWVDKNGNPTTQANGVRFYYNCKMTADIAKVNADKENMEALRSYTGANPGVKFTKLQYQFSVWDTGLFRHWHTLEGWSGQLLIVKGDVNPNNPTYYSYRKENTFMEDFAKFLMTPELAKANYGITYDGTKTLKDGKVIHDSSLDKSGFIPA